LAARAGRPPRATAFPCGAAAVLVGSGQAGWMADLRRWVRRPRAATAGRPFRAMAFPCGAAAVPVGSGQAGWMVDLRRWVRRPRAATAGRPSRATAFPCDAAAGPVALRKADRSADFRRLARRPRAATTDRLLPATAFRTGAAAVPAVVLETAGHRLQADAPSAWWPPCVQPTAARPDPRPAHWKFRPRGRLALARRAQRREVDPSALSSGRRGW